MGLYSNFIHTHIQVRKNQVAPQGGRSSSSGAGWRKEQLYPLRGAARRWSLVCARRPLPNPAVNKSRLPSCHPLPTHTASDKGELVNRDKIRVMPFTGA